MLADQLPPRITVPQPSRVSLANVRLLELARLAVEVEEVRAVQSARVALATGFPAFPVLWADRRYLG